MGTTIKHPLFLRRNAEDQPSSERETPSHSVATDDLYDDSEVGLTDWPDILPRQPRRARLPSVDAFDLNEACAAQNLARKFGPRARHRVPDRKRWNLPRNPNHLNPVLSASQKSPGKGRGFLWGICTAVLVILVVPAVISVAPSIEGFLPAQTADPRDPNTVATNGDAPGLAALANNQSAATGSTAYSEETARVRIRQATGVSTAHAAPALPPDANAGGSLPEAGGDGGSTIAERSDTPATDGRTFDPVATVLEPNPLGIATPLSEAEPTIAPVREDEGVVRVAQAQQSAKIDPQIESKAAGDEGETKGLIPEAAAPTVAPTMAAEQLDYLLERGAELLRSGNIASARLLFLRIADAGDMRGAKGVAMTYDPNVFAQLAVTGLTPDREQADLWYEKAGETSFTIDLTLTGSSDTVAANTEEAGSFDRDAACARKYKSYEPRTGLYTSFSGAKRPCRLP